MLDSNLLVEVERLGDQVGVELVELLVEESSEVLWQLVGFLETRSQPVGKGRDVWHMMVLAQFRLVLNTLLQVHLIIEQPAEHGFLDLLVVLLFKEFVTKELNRAGDEQLASPRALVKSSDGSICGETDWPTRQNCLTWPPNVDGSSIWVYELEPTVFIPVSQLVFSISIFLGIFSGFVLVFICGSIGTSKIS